MSQGLDLFEGGTFCRASLPEMLRWPFKGLALPGNVVMSSGWKLGGSQAGCLEPSTRHCAASKRI